MPTKEAIDNRAAIAAIRRDLQAGKISYGQAKLAAAPVVKRINTAGRRVAKRHGKNYTPVNIPALLR